VNFDRESESRERDKKRGIYLKKDIFRKGKEKKEEEKRVKK
jgi:hypothetical protein